MDRIEHLRREIAKREVELAALKSELTAAEADHETESSPSWKWPLSKNEYERYSRQMVVPKFGYEGQLRLSDAKVLVVGAGGLGCPAAAYLASAGIGILGLVDGDEVEVSNLHRQIAHSTERVGMKKVESAIVYLRSINPSITYNAHKTHLSTSNARDIVSCYDLVLDCTDHPTSRYLISDICVLLGKPLVSASAFQTSGQLIVLNNPPGKAPCYRCFFPKPPPPDTVVGCGEGGILGPVVGAMGVLQALEAIKLIAKGGLEVRQDEEVKPTRMLLFDGMGDSPFRTVMMRSRRANCFACADIGGLTMEQLESSLDYVQFCGVPQPVKILAPEERVTAEQYDKLAKDKEPHILLDVRDKEHFGLCHLEGSQNIPFQKFLGYSDEALRDTIPADAPESTPIYFVCGQGNDSQIAVKKLKDLGMDGGGARFIGDIEGGLRAYKARVDPTMPV